MAPKYDLDKIKYATDAPTFERTVYLYEKGKVTQFKEEIGAYSAVVLGTKLATRANGGRECGDRARGKQHQLCYSDQ